MRNATGSRVAGSLIGLLLSAALAAGVAACGGSGTGAGAQALLNQTFSGPHAVKSGVLSFDLTLTPSGSSTLKGPISLGMSGPFQGRGAGQLPESDLSVNIDALGHHGQIGIVSTGSNGYVVLKGIAYQLPAADYQRLATSFTSVGGSSGGLAKLGIRPLHWLTSPTIVGNETVAGTPTTHVRTGVDVARLLDDLSTFLQKASSTGATGTALPTVLSSSTRQRIAATVKHPVVDVWTGASDKTLRKLTINLNVPVTGQISTLLGGLSSAGIGITVQYANLNQPQTIPAPTNVQPYSSFAPKLRGILRQIQGGLGSSGLGAAGSNSSLGSTTTGSAAVPSTSSNVQKYSQCIQQAGSDVSKMQKCASLLNGG